MTLDAAAIRRAARRTLGHQSLLPGQSEAIAAITDGRDTLALLPTGGGKSAIYQLAGEAIDGPTVVVSPLIALQQDQLDALIELGLSAAALNSAIPARERDAAIADFVAGRIEFLLLAPEQLADNETLARLRKGRPSLFVVDEAHCVAEWGSDFRPEYRRLAAAAEALGRPPILGLTATASPLLREEIIERLELRDPLVVARGFDRPNIRLLVEHAGDRDAKRRAVVERVASLEPPGIVYVATRSAATEVARELRAAGVNGDAYHAGLGARRRAEIQDAFMSDEIAVIVATIAFGMGIDKPDVRFVAHHDVSESLDAYHQEIGRAGRDDAPAQAILFYRAEDVGLRRFQAAPPRFDVADVARLLRALRTSDGGAGDWLAGAAGLSQRRTDAILGRLEDLDVVEIEPDGRVLPADGEELDVAALGAQVVARQERRRAVERSRVEMIRAYAEATGCRRAFLLGYFGEPFEPPCGNCDICLAPDGAAKARAATDMASGRPDDPLVLNDRVLHATFGGGVVTAVEGDRVTVAFDAVGYRILDMAAAARPGVLAREER